MFVMSCLVMYRYFVIPALCNSLRLASMQANRPDLQYYVCTFYTLTGDRIGLTGCS